MRASTLFALTAAVILGLVVATAAKYSGFFAPPVVVAPVAKKQDIQVLVAARNLFAGDTIDPSGVKVRLLRPEEVDDYLKVKDQFMPPVVQAASLRLANKNIYADQPILKSDLKDMVKPDALNLRLMPQMRAINLSIPKDRSAGGQIQVGEWIDVMLTSEIEGDHHRMMRTASIAPKVRVIAKRNTLWPIFAPLPEGKPVDFTIEVNPYRAALIEWSRSKGDITLTPLPSSEQRVLEVQRDRLMQNPQVSTHAHFMPPDSPEADDEDARVVAYNKGEFAVSEFDLIRIFGLKTAAPPISTVAVERMYGVHRVDSVVFTASGSLVNDGSRRNPNVSGEYNSKQQAPSASPSFQFRMPDCPTCGLNNKGKKTTK